MKVKVMSMLLVLVMMLAACSSKYDEETSREVNRDSATKTSESKTELKKEVYVGESQVALSEVSVTMDHRTEIVLWDSVESEEKSRVNSGHFLETWPTPTTGETYEEMDENGFKLSFAEPLSTFSIDVDTASYSNVRRFLQDGMLPPKEAVKIEEMINYFDYDYKKPWGSVPFSLTTEIGVCPWNEEHHVAMIGLKGKEIQLDERQKTNLVFLLDVSGSMDNPDKLPLLKEGFRMLVEELGENDKVSIVVYAGASGVVLEGTTGEDKQLILDRLYDLDAGGSTAGGQGIELAYNVAKKYYIRNGNNRVILATDGDFNVGLSSKEELEEFIEEKKEEGIFLSVLGFGTGNTNFVTMETLADRGNGMFAYIDSAKEAEKVLVEEMAGTLYTIAKDVKIQVEFNPALVKSYRLIGYENRMLNKEDFNDDKVDAGDIGAGHRVTALYEIELYDANESIDDLRYQEQKPELLSKNSDEYMYVKLRYKEPTGEKSKLVEKAVDKIKKEKYMSDDLRFALAVSEFGLILKDSDYKADADFDHIYELLVGNKQTVEDEYKLEFLSLVALAKSMTK